MNRKAIALLSGGLDSMLAILAVLRQGISVKAIRFRTPFDPVVGGERSRSDIFLGEDKTRFDIEVLNPGLRFLDIVRNPKHGYGKNMNPCIDCRIFMLKEARTLMERTVSNFIVTGEVIGQRPMSQKKDMLYHIDKEAGVTGLVLRPLSAKLLKSTVPEQLGHVRRELLFDFSGRSRKPQMRLAREWGLDEYPSPAGGCLLTEPNYACRLRDLLRFDAAPSMRDIDLLKIGRHFRLSPACKIVIGRDESENTIIDSVATDADCLLRVEGFGSPSTLVTGEINDEAKMLAASFCARYSDAKHMSDVQTVVMCGGRTRTLMVSPAEREIIDAFRIEEKNCGRAATI